MLIFILHNIEIDESDDLCLLSYLLISIHLIYTSICDVELLTPWYIYPFHLIWQHLIENWPLHFPFGKLTSHPDCMLKTLIFNQEKVGGPIAME
jgi:hypothetical protein